MLAVGNVDRTHQPRSLPSYAIVEMYPAVKIVKVPDDRSIFTKIDFEEV